MKKLTNVLVISLVAMQIGCANTGANYRPMIDTRGGTVNAAKYETDLQECQQYANQTAGAAEKAAFGAVAGALFGAVLAAAAGGGYDRGASARVGAVTGLVGGAAQGDTDQKSIIQRCLNGRGYSVLQ